MRIVLVLLGLLGFASHSLASGFFLLEQSPRQMGHAFSGSTALGEDASTIFYNPAGMSRLEGQNFSAGVSYLNIDSTFEDKGSNQTGVGALSGGDGGNGGENATVPSLFYAYNRGDWAFGIGVFVPFGLTTKFDDGWQGRYLGIESTVETLNINPSLSYQFNEKLAVGFGLNYQTLKAKLTNAIDIGTACVATQTEALGDASQAATACANQGLSPQQADATSEISGTSTGYGFNLGFMYDAMENLRLGLAYRSGINHKIKGEAKYKNVPESFTNGGTTLVNTDVETETDLPAVINLGAVYSLSSQLTLLSDISYVQWSVFDELKIEYDSEQEDEIEEFNWRDTWRLATGAKYMITDQWLANVGLSYDQGPIKGRKDRNVRLPDNDRYWVTFGGEYTPMENLNVAMSYAHIFFENAQVEQSTSFGHNVKGTFETSIDILALQVNYQI